MRMTSTRGAVHQVRTELGTSERRRLEQHAAARRISVSQLVRSWLIPLIASPPDPPSDSED